MTRIRMLISIIRIAVYLMFHFNEEKEYFIENLSMLLASGMTIGRALEAIKVDLKSNRLKQSIANIEKDIDSGLSMWKALDNSKLLPLHTIALIRTGELSGKLPENLKVVVMQQEKEREFNAKVRSAMMYPLLVLSLTLVIGVGITWFLLPKLATVFKDLKIPLPVITKIVISSGVFLGNYGMIVVPLALLLAFWALFFLFVYEKTKHLGQTILFTLPGVGKLLREVELARMGYILGTLLDSGLSIIDSIDALTQVSTLFSYKAFYAYLQNRVEEGRSFQKSFATYPKTSRLIPTPIQQLIVSAEQSGNLPQTFQKIGEMFEAKTEITTKNLAVILEPVLLVIVWLGVMAVALSVILPIYGLIGGLNQ